MSQPSEAPKNPLREIVQPFVDLVHAPRALWGVNLAYMLEGMAYFGVLGYLAIYFSDFVFEGVPNPDVYAHHMVMVLTAGITIAMFFLGFVADKCGRPPGADLGASCCCSPGASLIAGGADVLACSRRACGRRSTSTTMAGILLVVVGYGMYQPAAYAAVRQFTTPKTAGMAYAMLYALMNLGGWLPTLRLPAPRRQLPRAGHHRHVLGLHRITVLALVSPSFILTRKTVPKRDRDGQGREQRGDASAEGGAAARKTSRPRPPPGRWPSGARCRSTCGWCSRSWPRRAAALLAGSGPAWSSRSRVLAVLLVLVAALRPVRPAWSPATRWPTPSSSSSSSP